MLKFTIAGESHGDSLVAVIENIPYKTPVNIEYVNKMLRLRNRTFGRGSRMKIEDDKVEILTGVRNNYCLGSPLTLRIKNSVSNIDQLPPINTPRPGHADLPAMKRYKSTDARDFTEFASARLTAIRTAVGAFAESVLSELGIVSFCRVIQVGDKVCTHDFMKQPENDILCCEDCYRGFQSQIENAIAEKDTIGGAFEVVFLNVPAGIGSIVPVAKRLNARFFAAISSIQTVRAVELGAGVFQSRLKGSQAHGRIRHTSIGSAKKDDLSGGIEGGLTNGSIITIKAYCKPVSTVRRGFDSVNVVTKDESRGGYERSDTFAVASCSVIARTQVSFELLAAITDQFYAVDFDSFKGNFDRFVSDSQNI